MIAEFLQTLFDWWRQRPWLVWEAIGLSLCTLLAVVVVVPWLIVRIPPDYFAHNRPPQTVWASSHPVLRAAALAIKNAIGLLLLLAGFVMLFVPGPGVITMLIGLGLMDLPGKRALERWIVARPAVFSSLNQLRAKHNQPPLVHPLSE